MANVATLTLKGTSDLRTIAADLRSVGTESQKAGTSLKTVTTELDKGSKSATSFGQKVKSFGSTFSTSIASIGTLGGTVLNLSRQYQDLSDSQIRVDRSALKVSKTTEAVGVAQGKLNALTAKGVTAGAEYDKALLDVKQALEAQDIAERNLQEAQEDHQRAQENFWIGLVPTVTSAGASIVSVLNDIGGTKGIAGLVTKLGGLKNTLKTAFSGLTGAGNIASGIAGIGSAASGSVEGINGMTKATVGLGGAMRAMALSALPVTVALGGVALIAKSAGLVIHEVLSIMKGDMLEAVKSMEKLIDFYTQIGSVIPQGAGFAIFTALKPEVTKLRQELEKVPQAIKPIPPALQGMDNVAQGRNTTIDDLVGGVLQLTRKAETAAPPLNTASSAMTGLGTAATTTAPAITEMGASLDTTSGSFATITSNVGTASTGIAGMNAQMNPFNATLKTTVTNTKSESTELQKLMQAANAAARMNQQLASAVNKASQSMLKGAQAANKYNTSLGAGHYSTGGTQPGTVVNMTGKGGNARYVTFRGGKQIASGYGTAPPYRKAASGMHETVSEPTWILAGEAGKERVDIGKNDGGGGFSGTINVYVDGVLRPARYDMGARK